MSATRPLIRLDVGWLYVAAGLALCAASLLVPAGDELADLRRQVDAMYAARSSKQDRLRAYSDFVDDLDREDPALVRRLAASQLNLVEADRTPVLLAPSARHTVTEWIDRSVATDVEVAPPPDRSLLGTLAAGRARLWMLGAGVLAVFVGLIIDPAMSRLRLPAVDAPADQAPRRRRTVAAAAEAAPTVPVEQQADHRRWMPPGSAPASGVAAARDASQRGGEVIGSGWSGDGSGDANTLAEGAPQADDDVAGPGPVSGPVSARGAARDIGVESADDVEQEDEVIATSSTVPADIEDRPATVCGSAIWAGEDALAKSEAPLDLATIEGVTKEDEPEPDWVEEEEDEDSEEDADEEAGEDEEYDEEEDDGEGDEYEEDDDEEYEEDDEEEGEDEDEDEEWVWEDEDEEGEEDEDLDEEEGEGDDDEEKDEEKDEEDEEY